VGYGLKKIDQNTEAEFLATLLKESVNPIDKDLLDSVEPEYFGVESYQWLVSYMKKRDWKYIDRGFMDQVLINEISDEEKLIKYKGQITLLYDRELKFSEDAVSEYRYFIAERKIQSTIKEALSRYNVSNNVSYLFRDLRKGLSESEEIVRSDKLKLVDYVETYDERMKDRRRERDNPDSNPVIRTGIGGLDNQFKLKKGYVVDVLAPFKRGKSILLNTFAFSAFLQNYNVCQVIFENSLNMTFDRFDALFTQTSLDRISNLLISKEEKLKSDNLFNWMSRWDNKLKVIKAKSNETSVSQIRDELVRYKEKTGWHPDVLVVDYLNIIGAEEKDKRLDERLQQKNIFWNLKNMTEEFNVLTYIASQTNMEGVKDFYGSGRLKLSSRGKSIDISQGLDLSIAIDQSEEEKAGNIFVLSPHFYRHGAIMQDEVVLDSNIDLMTFDRSITGLWSEARKTYDAEYRMKSQKKEKTDG
jgi:KaiC/GvpD/RAD55 family RecA-like ATPase